MSKQIAKCWTFQSSSGSGTYETLQYTDGSSSCGCPGWTRRCQSDGSRSCKHTRYIDQGIADLNSISHHDYGEPVVALATKPIHATQKQKAAANRQLGQRKFTL